MLWIGFDEILALLEGVSTSISVVSADCLFRYFSPLWGVGIYVPWTTVVVYIPWVSEVLSVNYIPVIGSKKS